MAKNNPADMSNDDLEKDMEQKNQEAKEAGNQEHVNKSTASEGALITSDEDEASKEKIGNINNDTEEQDLDELVHQQPKQGGADSQDGSLPDPEELSAWEGKEDFDKTSG